MKMSRAAVLFAPEAPNESRDHIDSAAVTVLRDPRRVCGVESLLVRLGARMPTNLVAAWRGKKNERPCRTKLYAKAYEKSPGSRPGAFRFLVRYRSLPTTERRPDAAAGGPSGAVLATLRRREDRIS
jgi:hypothetical protein